MELVSSDLAILNIIGKCPQFLMSSLVTYGLHGNNSVEFTYEWNQSNLLSKILINKNGEYNGQIELSY